MNKNLIRKIPDENLDKLILELLEIEKSDEQDETSMFDPDGRWSPGADIYLKSVTVYYWKNTNKEIEDLFFIGTSFSTNKEASDWLISTICDPVEDKKFNFGLREKFLDCFVNLLDEKPITIGDAIWIGILADIRFMAEAAYLCLLCRKECDGINTN